MSRLLSEKLTISLRVGSLAPLIFLPLALISRRRQSSINVRKRYVAEIGYISGLIFFISPTTAAMELSETRHTRLSKKRSGLITGPLPVEPGGAGGVGGTGGVGGRVGGDGFEVGVAGLALNFVKSAPNTSSGSVRVSKLSSFRNALTTSLSFASKFFRGGAIVMSPPLLKLIPMYSLTSERSKNRV